MFWLLKSKKIQSDIYWYQTYVFYNYNYDFIINSVIYSIGMCGLHCIQ